MSIMSDWPDGEACGSILKECLEWVYWVSGWEGHKQAYLAYCFSFFFFLSASLLNIASLLVKHINTGYSKIFIYSFFFNVAHSVSALCKVTGQHVSYELWLFLLIIHVYEIWLWQFYFLQMYSCKAKNLVWEVNFISTWRQDVFSAAGAKIQNKLCAIYMVQHTYQIKDYNKGYIYIFFFWWTVCLTKYSIERKVYCVPRS